jgi:hypothetical protein
VLNRFTLTRLRLIVLVSVAATACGGSGSTGSTAAVPDTRPLAFLAAEHVVVTPTFALRVAQDLGWTDKIGRPRVVLRSLDSVLATALDDRGLGRSWILPPKLEASFARNPTYAPDPYALAEEPLRSPSFVSGSRLPEPLASQLRTMIALHENARLVLAPVELRIDRVSAPQAPALSAAGSTGRATLRVALIDPRFSEAKWIGEVKSDTASALTPAMTASLARRLVDLIAAP